MMFPGKLFQINFAGIIFQKCDKGHTDLKCHVPFFALSNYLNGWACVSKHLPVYLHIIFPHIFQAEENQPNHPGNSQSCKVLVHALTFFMLENTNSLLHLEKINTF